MWRRSRGTRSSCARGTPCPTRCTRTAWSSGSPRRAEATLRRLYAPALAQGVPFIATDMATAELVKSAANAYLATKISFINAMAEICDATGADVATLADALGHDPRIGRLFLDAGLGFGGGCLPKGIRAFRIRAGELGVGEAVDFLREVDEINLRRRRRAVDVARPWSARTPSGAVAWVCWAPRSGPAATTCAIPLRCTSPLPSNSRVGWCGCTIRPPWKTPGPHSRPWTTRSTW